MLNVSSAGFGSSRPWIRFISRFRNARSMEIKCPTRTSFPAEVQELIKRRFDPGLLGHIGRRDLVDDHAVGLQFRLRTYQPVELVAEVDRAARHAHRTNGNDGILFFVKPGQLRVHDHEPASLIGV